MSSVRRSGILLHPASIPSKYGIGDFGNEAFEFVKFLQGSRQRLWQVLPLGPTTYGNSPYSSISTFAGNELLISPEKLAETGLVDEKELEPFKIDNGKINYNIAYKNKFSILELAHKNFLEDVTMLSMDQFVEENVNWLDHYTVFRAIKDHYNQIKWSDWPDPLKNCDNTALKKFEAESHDRITFYQFTQYIFSVQWRNLKNFANASKIEIIGDLPIYVAFDSADVWSNPQLFQLNQEKHMEFVAGVPPDGFSRTGQLWGNPLYNWTNHVKTEYTWWKSRIQRSYLLFDIVRFDHYRGFIEYWKIPASKLTGIAGEWVAGPGITFLETIDDEVKNNIVIVEDPSGVMKPELFELRDKFGFMGMRIMQNGFTKEKDPHSIFLPHNYSRNSIVYTGTHDNEPILGWIENIDSAIKDHFQEYTNSDGSNANWVLIDLALKSKSKFAVFQLQDILSLDNKTRMNIPGTAENNWVWMYNSKDLTSKVQLKLRNLTEQSGR